MYDALNKNPTKAQAAAKVKRLATKAALKPKQKAAAKSAPKPARSVRATRRRKN